MIFIFTVKYKGVEYQATLDEIDRDLTHRYISPLVGRNSPTIYLRHFIKRAGKRSSPLIHRLIMERIIGRALSPKEHVDHIDGNGLNNVRANLRIATVVQNQANARVRKDNKIGVKGVHERDGKYSSAIRVKGRQEWLGTFPTIEEAQSAYFTAAKHYYGEFANNGNSPAKRGE